MKSFIDRTYLSLEGDKVTVTYDGITLKVSVEAGKEVIELKGVQFGNWYEKGEFRIKLEEDAIYVSRNVKGFPVNAVKYFRMD